MMDWIGWVATAVFAASYLCRDPAVLRRVQAVAALLWMVYGALIGASPVVVANLIVAGVALGSTLARKRPPKDDRDVVAPALVERIPQ
jgi:Bacterial inner membrane protein